MSDHASSSSLTKFGSRYPKQIGSLRVAIGIWLLAVTAMLYATGHGLAWGLLLIPVAVLHFALAWRLFRIARSRDPEQRVRFQ